LPEAGVAVVITRVDNGPAFEDALSGGSFDAILADYHLPASTASRRQQIRDPAPPELPFIFLSGSIGEELAIERVKQGATELRAEGSNGAAASAVRRALAEAAERSGAGAPTMKYAASTPSSSSASSSGPGAGTRDGRLRPIPSPAADHPRSSPAIALKDSVRRYTLTNREFDRSRLSGDAIAAGTRRTICFQTPLAAARHEVTGA